MTPEKQEDQPKLIAFYLPQYHPIKENDEWWGKGFTEWTNVTKARPNFEGHYQPHVPTDLGYYDLRLPETREGQATLARQYGIYGFCYYYYWFSGRKVLDKPLNDILSSGKPDFPFCICWANENWTRTWDGLEKNVLLAQNHCADDDLRFIQDVLPILKDQRYIQIDGKPLLIVYRVDLFPDAKKTVETWRTECLKAGLPGIHLCAVQFYGVEDPTTYGFDSSLEFPPHRLFDEHSKPISYPEITNPNFRGSLIDYQSVVAKALNRECPKEYSFFRGVMPSWDNTARRQDTGHIFINSSPDLYEFWLREIVEQTKKNQPPSKQFIFINAWNEWGEGCHLEPDKKYDHAFLSATQRALSGKLSQYTVQEKLRHISALSDYETTELTKLYASYERGITALYRQCTILQQEIDSSRNFSKSRFFKLVKTRLSRYPKLKYFLKSLLNLFR